MISTEMARAVIDSGRLQRRLAKFPEFECLITLPAEPRSDSDCIIGIATNTRDLSDAFRASAKGTIPVTCDGKKVHVRTRLLFFGYLPEPILNAPIL